MRVFDVHVNQRLLWAHGLLLQRAGAGVVQRIVLNPYTTNPRWTGIVADIGKRGKDDTIYLVLAEAGGFGISLERYAGEVPSVAVKGLPPMGWASSGSSSKR